MAMLLVVATTEATDPMRVSVSLQTTANVVESLSVRLPGATRGSNELRVRIIGEGGRWKWQL